MTRPAAPAPSSAWHLLQPTGRRRSEHVAERHRGFALDGIRNLRQHFRIVFADGLSQCGVGGDERAHFLRTAAVDTKRIVELRRWTAAAIRVVDDRTVSGRAIGRRRIQRWRNVLPDRLERDA